MRKFSKSAAAEFSSWNDTKPLRTGLRNAAENLHSDPKSGFGHDAAKRYISDITATRQTGREARGQEPRNEIEVYGIGERLITRKG